MSYSRSLIVFCLGLVLTFYGGLANNHAASPRLNLPLQPPSALYDLAPLWSNLTFNNPISIHGLPGDTNRLFVLERTGRIMVVTNLAQPTKSIFLDLSDRVTWNIEGDEAGLLGMAFHPHFATNGLVFLYYTTTTTGYAGLSFYDRLSRFSVSAADPNQAELQSETIILQQHDSHGYHNSGSLFFGQDGYLYLSLGDEGGGYEPQNVDKDFFSGIIRIDVDKKPGNLPPNPHPASSEHYLVPQDNPFIGISEFNRRPIDPRKVRTEFFIVGTRNPWRISQDSATGLIYGNDVGDRNFEEVNLYLPGGNYGWYAYEGLSLYPRKYQPHFTNMIHFKPLALYDHTVGNAILGSLPYRGARYRQLQDKYLFSDFGSRRFGAINLLPSTAANQTKDLIADLQELKQSLRDQIGEIEAGYQQWESDMKQAWSIINFSSILSSSNKPLNVQADGSILVSGSPAFVDNYTLTTTLALSNVTAIRIEAMPDPSLINGGPGRNIYAPNEGVFVLSKLRVFANQTSGSPMEEIIPNYGKASFENFPDYFGALGSLDGSSETGWNTKPQTNQSNYAVFLLDTLPKVEELKIVLEQQHGSYSVLGRFRISVTTNGSADYLVAPYSIQAILDKPEEERNAEEQMQLREYYMGFAPETKGLRESIQEKSFELASLIDSNRQSITWFAEGAIAPSFFVHPTSGAILFPDLSDGRIKMLVELDDPQDTPIPTNLSSVAAFDDLPNLAASSNLFPYEINHPFWSDNAVKKRWLSLPEDGQITPHAHEPWSFPAGTVFVKHFDLEMEKGVPASSKRLETRFLVLADDSAYGVTYRWNEAQSEAMLVGVEGDEASYTIQDGGLSRTQDWYFPSRGDCMRCHTPQTKFVLGFNTAQLNCPTGNPPQNQLEILAASGLLSGPLENPDRLPALVSLTNSSANREYRLRSYLDANCSGCHRPGGSGRGGFDARFQTPRDQAKIINGMLVDSLGNSENRVIKPGEIDLSVLYQRIANLGEIHMPPLATSVINEAAVELLQAWIAEDLAGYRTYEEWTGLHFIPDDPLAARDVDADGDGLNNYVEYLAERNPVVGSPAWLPAIELVGDTVIVSFDRLANVGVEVQWTADLSAPNWQRLDHPANAPFWSDGNGVTELQDEITGTAKYYRMLLHTP